ncbi:hypothetical protein F4553_006988 [Allocatelliglobosispora scoriae]|uniref:Uncharacterized protein n=1 Tax=Allocatelliglobosispora scoriae TaxID=643052 RepID=A0A841BZJ2_9ACTN|nr:hypothetical protein [Allocatelliglobosispora scoriae]MBB5873554.1 hypothetical protein [Allocatelliglobosispora scoriae]
MTDELLAIVTMIVAADDEERCRGIVEQATARLDSAVQAVRPDADRPGRWNVLVHATDPRWLGDGSDDSYATVVTDVLARLGVPPGAVEVKAARPTAYAVLGTAESPVPAIEWTLVEAWDVDDHPGDDEPAELLGEGEELTEAELAELAGLLETRVWLVADLRGHDQQSAGQVVAGLAERLQESTDTATITGYQPLDGGLLRVALYLGGTRADPADAIDAVIQRIAAKTQTPPTEWTIDRTEPVGAVWTSRRGPERGITRIELRAGHTDAP